MINNKTILAVITARKGSKRLKNKNLIPLDKKPLIQWTIEEAIKSKYIDRLIISTDDENIISLASKFNGVTIPFIRPENLSSDKATSVDVIKHALSFYESNNIIFDYVLLLQPTSPLRICKDIDDSIQELSNEIKSVVSVCETDHSPLWSNELPENKSMKDFLPVSIKNLRSQDLPTFYRLNGAVYVSDVEYLIKENGFFGAKTKAYLMPKDRSIDIDNELDLLFAESIIKSNSSNII